MPKSYVNSLSELSRAQKVKQVYLSRYNFDRRLLLSLPVQRCSLQALFLCAVPEKVLGVVALVNAAPIERIREQTQGITAKWPANLYTKDRVDC